MAVAIRAIEAYPDDLLAHLADPARGIVRKSKFIPSVAEMCAFMDSEFDRQRKDAEFRKRERERALPKPIEAPTSLEQRLANIALLRNSIAPVRGSKGQQGVFSQVEKKLMAEAWLAKYKANPPKLPKLSGEAIGSKTRATS